MAAVPGTTAEYDGVLRFALTVGELKDSPRQGWLDNGVAKPESVAAHMHRMSVLCMLCPDRSLDRDRCIRMALCHDMAEAIVGDVSPQMKVSKAVKAEKELEAMGEMAALLKTPPPTGADGQVTTGNAAEAATMAAHGEEVHALFVEYEVNQTPEAHFVHDLDLLDMVIQAYRYERDLGRTKASDGVALVPREGDASATATEEMLKLNSFFDRSRPKLTHPWAIGICDRLMALRKDATGALGAPLRPIPARLLTSDPPADAAAP